MKKLKNTTSPFILLLLPLFLLTGILSLNLDTEIPVEKQKASLNFQVPAFHNVVSAILR